MSAVDRAVKRFNERILLPCCVSFWATKLALALLAFLPTLVDAAIRDSSGSGNTGNATYAFGSAVATNDQLRVTNTAHAITFDSNVTIGTSLCTSYQTRPTVSATGSGGSLPAGAYRVRIAAVGSTGTTTASSSSLQATITSGQVVRVTLPTLPAGATSWNVYLSQASGAAGSEKEYATGQAAGTFDCSSASWTNGTTTYAAANGLPFGDAFGYSSPTAHSGGVIISDNVTVTCKGDFSHLGDLTLGHNSILELDATDSPSGAAIYRVYSGTINAAGTAKIIMRGASGNRAIIRSKSGTTPGQVTNSVQTSNSGPVRLDLQWGRFSNLGGASYPAVNAFNNVASFNHTLSDVVFDADCRELKFDGQPATSGWVLNRVAFRQTSGNSYGGLSNCCVAFQVATSADVTTGTRTVTDCAFEVLPPALGRGGATYTRCYFNDVWADVPTGAGGTATSNYLIEDCFVRKTYTLDTRDLSGNTNDGYLYFDNVTGSPSTDLNPHGFGCPANGVGTTRTHQGWTIEYNDDDDSGDMFKSPGSAAGTVELLNNLIIPNAASKSSGTMFTFPNNPNSGYRLRCDHNTYVAGPYSLATSEGGAQPAGTISSFKSNLAFNIAGTTTGRYAIGKSDGNGATDTTDVVDAANAGYNAGWNLLANGNAGTWYNIKCTGTPGTGDVDLGDSAGADISTNGPRFVAPNRKFITWAVDVLGATGTDAQKITTGLNALKAVADTDSGNHVNGLLMTAPWTYVRDGFKVRNASLRNAGHDGVTIGALEYQSSFRPFWIRPNGPF